MFVHIIEQKGKRFNYYSFGAVFRQILALFIYFARVILIMAQDQVNGISSAGMRVIDS